MARDRDEMVGLDELFDAGRATVRADPRPVRRPSRPFDGRWWIRRLFVAVALTTVGWGVLWTARYSISYPLVLLTIVATQIMHEVLRQVRAEEIPAEVTGKGLEPVRPPDPATDRLRLRDPVPTGDGLRLAIGKWDDRLVWGERDPGRFAALVVPRVSDLVDGRLRQRYGITLSSAPEQARRIVGAELWQLLHYTPSRVPSPRDVASIVAKVEAL
ncbi:hypothetical protein Drose_33490 [Dactylosporangium roseum]|uniref:Uncharacterized protein n=1 Tax=Dactylosporangium roseum TaxID=47989 RepID=A0ABY5Z1P0_9ACTN|nr:hypothetical protein [Dactylosporangium roseum]UWZ35946.1 hypothetical protein Drose_33490 [Dactylosporangium roseum]